MSIAFLVAEMNAAVASGDLPRAERAALTLRMRYGVSLVDPAVPQPRYSPYRVLEAAP